MFTHSPVANKRFPIVYADTPGATFAMDVMLCAMDVMQPCTIILIMC